ncbi:MAG: Hcp family type VI secretion system effector [Candidatus Hodarchaeales archaeon]|jgi:type VI secretion system secreted protein Hcp
MRIIGHNKLIKGGMAAGIIFFIISGIFFLLVVPAIGAETNTTSVTGVSSGVTFFMWIEGASQGQIDGSVTTSGLEGSIEGYQYSHSVYIPTDPHSGQATGSRIHTPVIVVKEVDKSTPKLMQALITGETLIEVLIKFYRTISGTQNYFTVFLEDAKIVSIHDFMPNSLNPNTYQPLMEEVSFVYGKITWTWEEDGIEFADEWFAGPGS